MHHVQRWPSLLIALFTCAGIAQAQGSEILLAENFEEGFGNWEGTGLWNLESETDSCGSLVAPFPSSDQAAWWGSPTTCTFDAYPLAGSLTMASPVHIPAWAQSATLTFENYTEAECDSCGWDWRFIYVSRNGGPFDWVGASTVLGIWHTKTIDLSEYVGDDIQIRFRFDAVDSFLNQYLGWFIDDVQLSVSGCTTPVNYCDATQNSSGAAGEIEAIGSTSTVDNNLSLRARLCPAGQAGIFFYGAAQGAIFLGDGYRCLAGQSFRVLPVATINGLGRASRQLDLTAAPLGCGPGRVLPGSTWNFSFWFRDPQGAGGGFNYTDAVQITFCP